MDVINFLEFFLRQMLEWEVEYHKRRRSEEYKASADERFKADSEARLKLRAIFESSLSHGANESLACSRIALLNTGRPPEFAQSIISESYKELGGNIYIETVNVKALAPYRRYTIIMEDGKPKINAVHGRANEAAKWSSRESI